MVEEWGFYCGWHCEFSEGLQEELGVCPKCKQPTGYEKWKDLQLNFNPAEMLKG